MPIVIIVHVVCPVAEIWVTAALAGKSNVLASRATRHVNELVSGGMTVLPIENKKQDIFIIYRDAACQLSN